MTQPILRLNQSAKALTQGDWTHKVVIGRSDEVGELASSFNRMADQLQASFASLTEEIAEHQRTEAALRQAEEKYRSIFENAVEGIFQTTPSGQYIDANPALARMMGYASPQELLANITDIQQQLYVEPECRSELNRFLEEHDVVEGFEVEVYCKDGSTIWLSANARVVRDHNRHVLYYEGMAEDITERKQAEEALRESEAKFRDLAETSPATITIVQGNRQRYVNAMAEQLTGYTRAELFNMDFWDNNDDVRNPIAKARGLCGKRRPIGFP